MDPSSWASFFFEIHEGADDWKVDHHPYYNPFKGEWTGWTEFELEDDEVTEPGEELQSGVKRNPEENEEKA